MRFAVRKSWRANDDGVPLRATTTWASNSAGFLRGTALLLSDIAATIVRHPVLRGAVSPLQHRVGPESGICAESADDSADCTGGGA